MIEKYIKHMIWFELKIKLLFNGFDRKNFSNENVCGLHHTKLVKEHESIKANDCASGMMHLNL